LIKYKIHVSLRPGVKDIQSEAIFKTANANVDLGNNQLYSLKMGKWFEVECDDDFDINILCSRLLSNSVIENYTIEELDNGRDL
jgi:phosphoribosylformylglycinamidine synthase